jgi:hypothetical protein
MSIIQDIRKGIGDQANINAYFKNFTPLPARYSLLQAQFIAFGKIKKANKHKIIHFICKKLWKYGRDEVKTMIVVTQVLIQFSRIISIKRVEGRNVLSHGMSQKLFLFQQKEIN